MIRLADGDRSAFEPLFESLLPILQRFAARFVRDPVDAEDVVQQALLSIFHHASRFDRERDALSWAFGIAAWEARTLRRKRQRRREQGFDQRLRDDLEQRATSDDPETQFRQRQLADAARETLGSLSAVDTETLLAAYENGPRPAISPAAFRKRLERARQRLRAAWEVRHGQK